MVDVVDFYVKSAVGWWERIFPKPDRITWLEKSALAAHKAQGAHIATTEKDGAMLALVQNVYTRAGEKPPKLIIYKSDKPNAMHIGNGTIAIADSKIATSSQESLEATIAHEMGHHKQRFITLGEVVARGAIVFGTATALTHKLKPTLDKTKAFSTLAITATFSAIAALTHLITEPLHAMYRRWQEFDADKTSVKVTGSAAGIIHNLEGHAERKAERATHTPERKSTWKELTASHPSHEERIAHAKAVEAQMGKIRS
jgi:Zn-dependent protease with chaperone function